MPAKRRDAWVFLRCRAEGSAIGARVELVEARRELKAGEARNRGPGYAWAIFPETSYGTYTVRVTYPSGAHQTARLLVNETTHLITLDEPPT